MARYFHGSPHADLQPGDEVLPARKAGVENWTDYYDASGDDWRRDSVFMVGPYGDEAPVEPKDDPDTAERAAWGWAQGDRPLPGKRATVYEVEPVGDPVLMDPDFNEWTADSARVVRRIDIPPNIGTREGQTLAQVGGGMIPGTVTHRYRWVNDDSVTLHGGNRPRKRVGYNVVQGTLPPIAWQQFGVPHEQLAREEGEPERLPTPPIPGQQVLF